MSVENVITIIAVSAFILQTIERIYSSKRYREAKEAQIQALKAMAAPKLIEMMRKMKDDVTKLLADKDNELAELRRKHMRRAVDGAAPGGIGDSFDATPTDTGAGSIDDKRLEVIAENVRMKELESTVAGLKGIEQKLPPVPSEISTLFPNAL